VQTKVILHRDFTVAEVDPRLYGAHLGRPGDDDHRAVVDPEHPLADDDGLRTDVLDLARAFRLPCILGPVPHRSEIPLDRAIRVDGLVDWCRRTGAEPMLALPTGDTAVRRRTLGIGERHGVKMWHLGAVSEDGTEESLDDFITAMRVRDPAATLVLGASGRGSGSALHRLREYRAAPDLISLGDMETDLALPASLRLERAIAGLSEQLGRSGLSGPAGRSLGIQVDRWGAHGPEGAAVADDALDRAISLNVLIRHADRVRTAFAAKVLSGLAGFLEVRLGMGHGPTFYDPLLAGSVYGRGISLMPAVRGPVEESADGEALATVDCAVVRDDETGTVTLFLANRAHDTAPIEVDLHGFGRVGVLEHRLANPGPRLPGIQIPAPSQDGPRVSWVLPSRSYGMVRLGPPRA
jgi:alpha-N-arabinofuranosidase